MTTPSTQERADAALRELIALADPEATPAPVPADLLDRVRAAAEAPEPELETGTAGAGPAIDLTDRRAAPSRAARPSFGRRHWQAGLMVAASLCSLALAAGTVLPGLLGATGGEAGSASQSTDDSAGRDGGVSPDQGAPSSEGGDVGVAGVPGNTGSKDTADTVDRRLVRSGSVLVGAEDLSAARDTFVAAILAMGGRVMSESVVTRGGDGGGVMGYDTGVADDVRVSYPYPWYPTGPGIWLTIEVPVAQYEKAIDAARAAGEVVQLQQSSYDVGTQIADTAARIKALEASLARLTALMDRAQDISDVISLEQAIASRQSELDALRAQARDLANQTAMSQISLTLMSPDDAQQAIDPQPRKSWWESFLEGLSQFWTWLGQALLIVSPLLVAAVIIWFVRRRRARDAGGSAGGGAAPEPGPAA